MKNKLLQFIFGDLFWMAWPIAAAGAFATYKMHINAEWAYLEEVGSGAGYVYFSLSVLLWGWKLFDFQIGERPVEDDE